MKVLCLAGAWCGDCVNQCPIFDHFARLAPSIQLRFFDRDAHPDLSAELKICGGGRVPVVVFLSEDGQLVGWYGDRTLSKYRQMAIDQLGAACPTGIVPPGRCADGGRRAGLARRIRTRATAAANVVAAAAIARRLIRTGDWLHLRSPRSKRCLSPSRLRTINPSPTTDQSHHAPYNFVDPSSPVFANRGYRDLHVVRRRRKSR